MKESKIYEDLSPILKRARRSFFVVVFLFVILVFYLWKIQILDYQKFWKKSERNRIREVRLLPHRGLIRDRNGVILTENIGSFKASIIRENCNDFNASCQRISRLLELEAEVIKERVEKYKALPAFVPIVIKDNLSAQEIARIEGRKQDFPELVIQTEPKRFYPLGKLASHVIGYQLEVSPEELKSEGYRNRQLGDMVGKTGVERQYEDLLVGIEGQMLEVVDSLGRNMGELVRREPFPGKNIRLTLDVELQRKTEELLEGREGAAVILDPRSGEILALASYPNFDPNKFINRFSPQEWLDLVENPAFPLENRAIRGLYAPGSIFKLALAIGGLASGDITENTAYICNGSIMIYNHPFSCWFHQGHGLMNLYSGIEHSCNIYFYQLGKKMGIYPIARYARSFGFGSQTGVDLPGEKDGLVPDPEWKEKARGQPWYPGETISVAIGQGPITVTPLQVAAFTALIANRGKFVKPRLLKAVEGEHPPSFEREFLADKRVNIDPSVFQKVVKGMWMVVNQAGTARSAKIPGFDVCGKTGSTQVLRTRQNGRLAPQRVKIKTHSWFTGFAPRDEPKVAVTVLIEYGGGGGETAAPLARQLLDLYRERYVR